MSAGDVVKQITDVSQALIMADTNDPRALAELASQFEKISDLEEQDCPPVIARASASVADLIKTAILDESCDKAAQLDVVSRTLSVMQLAAEGETDTARIVFPSELGYQAPGAPEKPAGTNAVPPDADDEIFAMFLAEQKSTLEDIESHILNIEKGDDPEAEAALRRVLHTLKGEAGVLGLTDVANLCHAVEDFLDTAGAPIPTDPLLAVKDWLAAVFDDYAARRPLSVRLDDVLALLKTPEVKRESPEQGADVPPDTAEVELETVNLDADPSLLADFITEAREHMEAVDVHLLTLESDPKDEEALNAVFRAFHTIKGVAGFLSLEYIGNLAHTAETLLGYAQRGEQLLTGVRIDVVFDANDMLKNLISDLGAAMASGKSPSIPPGLPQLVEAIEAVISGESDTAEEGSRVPASKKKLGEILVDAGQAGPDDISMALAEQAADPQREKLGSYLVRSNAVKAKQVAYALRQQRGELTDRRKAPRDRRAEGPDRRAGFAGRRESRADRRGVQVRETVRVDTERLDHLVETIGELVIAESMVVQDPEILENTTDRVKKNLRHLSKVSRELQEMGTAMRMESVRGVFQKMARLVRDVAKKAGKKVNFRISGEDTELDRAVIDMIGDPLIHMVRNAVDHGIESQEERRAKGKPEEGLVHLLAYHKGGNVHIEIQDDGQGIDEQAILAKARERGLIGEEEKPSRSEIYNLIMEPGFSTAKVVTDISGRGVGMDVVHRNIEALRGSVQITSEPGKGSTFRMSLPLTLAIIDGMVIKVREQHFIIPILSIVETLRPTAEMLSTVEGKGELLSLRGEFLPLFRLDRLFGLADTEQDITTGVAIVLQASIRRIAITVDELVGQQQTVIKSLSSALGKREFLSGAAIMADGRVGLILDADGIMKLAIGQHKTIYTGEG